MGWELWFDEEPNRSYGHIGFFCNTVDESFGPIFMVDSCFDKSEFYNMWEKAGFQDPRSNEDKSLHTRHILKLMGYDANISATFKVYRIGDYAPYLIHEESIKTYFDNLEFSQFQDVLKALPEEDFCQLEYLIGSMNEDMKHTILTENLLGSEDEPTSVTFEEKTVGLRVVAEWEVLDEY